MSNIKNVIDSEAGKELKELILTEYSRLLDIRNVKDTKNAESQAIEIKANKLAVVILKRILDKIMSVPEDVIIDKELDQYNV